MNPLRALLSEDPTLVDLLDRRQYALDGRVPRVYWELALTGPAREMLRRPGKRFRARLVEAAWALAGGAAGALPAGLPQVVEILHAGSLIVDDIEDDSDERRGAPSLHRLVGVPLALNTGNWMYFWALDQLDRELDDARGAAASRAARRVMLACHQGQALDLAVRVCDVPQADVGSVVRATTELKTGALMGLAAELGAIAAGADDERRDALAAFGRGLGTGLQMLDDLGSVTAAARAAKGDEDLAHGRLTWAWAWLADELDELRYRDLRAQSRAVMNGEDPAPLRQRMRELLADRGRDATRRELATCVARLHSAVGDHPAAAAVEAEIFRLEQSYV